MLEALEALELATEVTELAALDATLLAALDTLETTLLELELLFGVQVTSTVSTLVVPTTPEPPVN